MHLILLITLILNTKIALSTCYSPNSTRETSPEYQPCIQLRNRKSMCCATNRSNPTGGLSSNGYTQDICLNNGLCQNMVSFGQAPVSTYWREQCSSPNWKRDCLDVCTRETEPDLDDGRVGVTPCDGTANSSTWCCGIGNLTCCNTTGAITILPMFIGYLETSTISLPSATDILASDGPGTSTSTSTPIPTSHRSALSNGAKVGIGVGVAVGAIAGLSVLVFVMRKRERDIPQPVLPLEYPMDQISPRQSRVVEKPADQPRHELA